MVWCLDDRVGGRGDHSLNIHHKLTSGDGVDGDGVGKPELGGNPNPGVVVIIVGPNPSNTSPLDTTTTGCWDHAGSGAWSDAGSDSSS